MPERSLCHNVRQFYQSAHKVSAPTNQLSSDNAAVPAWLMGNKMECYIDTNGKDLWASATWKFDVYRIPTYFDLNLMIPLSLFNVLALLTFSISLDDLGDRLGVSSTLLLATIALKFAYGNALPELPYLTVLDWKQVWTRAFICVILACHSIHSSLKVAQATERMVVWVLSALGLAAELYFVWKRYYIIRMRPVEVRQRMPQWCCCCAKTQRWRDVKSRAAKSQSV
jgi:hypothetical protein